MNRRHAARLPLAALALLLSGAAAPERADDFALLDHEGHFHRLSEQADAKAVVLFVQGNGCPMARGALPALRALRDELAPRGVVVLGLNPNPQDDRAAVANEAREYGIDFPILIDDAQLVAESLGVTRTAEAIVLAPPDWRIAWRGPVDDSQHYDGRRPARERYLRDALLALLEERTIATPKRDAPGCLIVFPPPAPASYADVAPILARRCGSCHREGSVAPFALANHTLVAGFGPMIRESVRTRRMPPWQPDPAIGRFTNATGLTRDEARALVHWIEAGAPRGDGPDPLAESAASAPPEWSLGPPDLVVSASEQEIPASGVVPYVYETLELPLARDVWVRAVELHPTNPRPMHHGIAWLEPPEGREPARTEGPRFTRGLLAGYVPGRTPEPLPEGTGHFVPAGSRIRFQLHYTTTGRAERDVPRLGLYFSERPLAHELATGASGTLDFAIPPGARDHRETAERTLSRDVLVYRWMPHMHYRGKSFRYEAHYPDGRVEPLLSVPRYRFGWQLQYVLAEPLRLPAGTRLVVHAAFDNSADNPANPDPTAWVRYGEQSSDEMLFGYFLYRDLDAPRAEQAGR